MALARSRITTQGQVSVPSAVRRKLGLAPGSLLEWNEQGDLVVVRRAGGSTSLEIHRALFPQGPPRRRSLDELKAGIRRRMRARHARG